jgi:hypothetical protein
VSVDDDRIEEWRIEEGTVPARGYRLKLRAPDERQWSGEARDLFECLIEIRNQIEPLGMRACCKGTRRDAWASGMQRDMGRGAFVYLLEGVPPKQRPPQVNTLDPAPIDTVASVAEQRAWHDEWLRRRSD